MKKPAGDMSSSVADVLDRFLSAIFHTSTSRYVHNTASCQGIIPHLQSDVLFGSMVIMVTFTVRFLCPRPYEGGSQRCFCPPVCPSVRRVRRT